MSPVVPMPAFTDPNLPEAAGGSVNFGVAGKFPGKDDHPVEHSPDYGLVHAQDAVEPEGQHEDDNRDGWLKQQWVELADAYGLDVSGLNKDDVVKVVEYHETVLDDEEVN